MITKQIGVDVSQGQAPYTYTFISDDDCITFSNRTGTTSNSRITTNITASTINCLTTANISVVVITKDGCRSTLAYNIDNPCDTFSVEQITQVEPFTFSVNASSPSCSNVSFSWSVDTTLFNIESVVSSGFVSTITIRPKITNSYPSSSSLSVTATDCFGCSTTRTRNFIICTPVVPNINVNMYCFYLDRVGREPDLVSGSIQFINTDPCGIDIDWSTIAFSLPNHITALPAGNDLTTRRFRGTYGTEPGLYTGQYTVANIYGVRSTVGTIHFIIPFCNEAVDVIAENRVFAINCATTNPGDTFSMNISDALSVGANVTLNWNTWAVVEPPNSHVGAANITLRTDLNGDRFIDYETINPIVNDAFSWRVATTEGDYIDAVVYTVLDCFDGNQPLALNDTATVACGDSISINVTSNDQPQTTVDNSSILVITPPSQGSVVNNLNGTITYTAPTNYSGTDQFTYRYANAGGLYSNIASVTVTVQCTPTITLSKTANKTVWSTFNESLTYSFSVTNTGDITVSNVVILDSSLSSNPIPIIPSTLSAGDVGVATFVTTAPGVSDGPGANIVNEATAQATYITPGGGGSTTTITATDTNTITYTPPSPKASYFINAVNHDLSDTVNTFQLSSLVLKGDQYQPTPQTIGVIRGDNTVNKINLQGDGILYTTNAIDALISKINAAKVIDNTITLQATYSTDVSSCGHYHNFNLQWVFGESFEIEFTGLSLIIRYIPTNSYQTYSTIKYREFNMQLTDRVGAATNGVFTDTLTIGYNNGQFSGVSPYCGTDFIPIGIFI